MEKYQLRSPFFVVNPKSYLYGEEEYKLAASYYHAKIDNLKVTPKSSDMNIRNDK